MMCEEGVCASRLDLWYPRPCYCGLILRVSAELQANLVKRSPRLVWLAELSFILSTGDQCPDSRLLLGNRG